MKFFYYSIIHDILKKKTEGKNNNNENITQFKLDFFIFLSSGTANIIGIQLFSHSMIKEMFSLILNSIRENKGF